MSENFIVNNFLKHSTFEEIIKATIDAKTGVKDSWRAMSRLNILDITDAFEHAVDLAQTLVNEGQK